MFKVHQKSALLGLALVFGVLGTASSQVTRLEADQSTVSVTVGGIVHTFGGAPENEASLNFLPTPGQAPPGTLIASPGRSHVLYLDANGGVWASGTNRFGELGNGTVAANPNWPILDVFPTAPTLLSQAAVGIEAGFGVSYAWDQQGVLFGWGTTTPITLLPNPLPLGSTIPITIAVPASITQVDSKMSLTVALDATGGVWHWGQESFAGVFANATVTAVNGLSNVVQVASGGRIAYAVTNQGNLFTWTLGTPTPVLVQGLPSIQSVAADGNYALAVDTSGVVWMIGPGPIFNGALGAPIAAGSPPVPVPGLPSIWAVGAAASSAYAADTQGRLWVWGDDPTTALGLGDPELKAWRPQTVPFSNQSPGMASVGTPCGQVARQLITQSTPTVGAEVVLTVFTSLQTALFIAPGPPTSTPWNLGPGCEVWLDPAGLDIGIASGLLPMPPTANALPPGGIVPSPLWIFDIPDLPSLIGQSLTVQALVIAPSELIPFATTNALTMSIR